MSGTSGTSGGASGASVSCVPLPLASTSTDPYGGEIYSYSNGDGTFSSYDIPPGSFSFQTSPAAEIVFYGFLPPPGPNATAAQQAQWNAQLTRKLIVPSPCESNAADFASEPVGSTSSSYNWSGVVDDKPTVSNYVSIEGTWDETGYKATCSSSAEGSDWVGLGGVNNESGYQRLIQTGVATTGNNSITQGFYEYLTAQNGQKTSGVNEIFYGGSSGADIPSGDTVQAQVVYKPGSPASATFTVNDLTEGFGYYPITLSPVDGPDGTFFDGTTAEWIDERPQVNGAYSNLRQWYNKNIVWVSKDSSNNEATDEAGTSYSATEQTTSHYPNMVTASGDELTLPLSVHGPESWTNYWNKCS